MCVEWPKYSCVICSSVITGVLIAPNSGWNGSRGWKSSGPFLTWTKTFLDRIYNRTGVKAMIYTSPSFWKNNMGDTQSFAAAGYRTLWIAYWTTLASPSIPAANWGGTGWTFWQYTSDGSVPGIQGRVDLDRYRYASFDRVSVP